MKSRILNVELIKPGDGITTNDSARSVQLSNPERLRVGGREGKKFRAKLEFGRYKGVPVIIKQLKLVDTIRVRHVIRSFILLKKKEYPVPDIVRYFFRENKDDKHMYLVMSDMTQNRKYYIWGFSDLMSKNQIQTLKKMKITFSEFYDLVDDLENIARRAARDGLSFQSYYYHIRRHKRTKRLDICLLDLDHSVWAQFKEGDSLEEYNLDQVNVFITHLLKTESVK